MDVGLIQVLLWLACAMVCMSIARYRGMRSGSYIVLGLLLGPAGIVVTLVAAALYRPLIPGDLVKLAIGVDTSDGGSLTRGTTAKLLEVDVIDNVPVGKIHVAGRDRWVARSVLDRA